MRRILTDVIRGKKENGNEKKENLKKKAEER
jgi:hypothetical protein